LRMTSPWALLGADITPIEEATGGLGTRQHPRLVLDRLAAQVISLRLITRA
jgi:hypothetical protein